MPIQAAHRLVWTAALVGVVVLAVATFARHNVAAGATLPGSSSETGASTPEQAAYATGAAVGEGGQEPDCSRSDAATPAASGGTPSARSDGPADTPPGQQATFHLCGTADPQTARAIEQLIAGRSFSATLASGADGCADLHVSVSPNAAAAAGRQVSTLNVSSGSGSSARRISVRIVSENGSTQVELGSGS